MHPKQRVVITSQSWLLQQPLYTGVAAAEPRCNEAANAGEGLLLFVYLHCSTHDAVVIRMLEMLYTYAVCYHFSFMMFCSCRDNQWRLLHRMWQPAFYADSVYACAPLMSDTTQKLVRHLDYLVAEGQPVVNIWREVGKLTMSIVGTAAYGWVELGDMSLLTLRQVQGTSL